MASEKAGESTNNAGRKETETGIPTVVLSRENAKLMQTTRELKMPVDKVVSLFASEGPLKGKIFPIQKPQITIGRAQADIVLGDPKISRNHCMLEVYGSSALLLDLNSANGTFVGEEKITHCELGHMSEFRVGSTTLMLTITDKLDSELP
ncbi:MAG: FHA domain-containing protein [Acidobacteria bacterium]|nr:FHA domain-containing protein [Acidobacteriota bacterium]